MGNILNNKKGSVIIGTMVAVFVLAISSTFYTLVITANRELVQEYDIVNTTTLGKSSADRVARYAPSLLGGFETSVNIPAMEVSITDEDDNTFFDRTYVLEGKATSQYQLNSIKGGYIEGEASVKVKDSGRKSYGGAIYKDTNNNPRADLAFGLRRDTYAGYFWLTNDDYSENGVDDPVWWWGDDLVIGRVHTNTNISIKNGHDGANNNGWPLFMDTVTQVKQEINWHSVGPMDEIFRGYPTGFAAEQAEVEFLATASLARQNGRFPFQGAGSEDIAWIDFADGSANLISGNVLTRPDSSTIYLTYPWLENNFANPTLFWTNEDSTEAAIGLYNPDDHEWGVVADSLTGHYFQDGVGPRIGVNIFTAKDTIWSPMNSLAPSTYFIEQETWASGTVSGIYTIASGSDLFVVNDITYADTPVENSLDASNVAIGDPVDNESDMLGLISEKKIKIRYGYMDISDPSNPTRVKPNSDDVIIYAAICALGHGESDTDTKNQGIFTYDYQDPQPSTQYWHERHALTDSAYVEAYPSELHLFIYPPSDEHPWPSVPEYDASTFYPTLPDELRQGLFQQLNNLVPGAGGERRSPVYTAGAYAFKGIDLPWRNPLWPEFDVDYERGKIIVWGGIHTMRRGFVHRSGSDPNNHTNDSAWDLEEGHWGPSSSGNGYEKDYHYDNRFRYVSPPNYPEANLKGGNKVGNSAIFAIQKTNPNE